MVSGMHRDLQYALLSEAELNELLAGNQSDRYGRWPDGLGNLRFAPGFVGLLWESESPPGRPPRPLALVAPVEEHRRLFNRFAQLRSDLTPLSAWCHLISPTRFALLHEPDRSASLQGFEAAWAGLAVAETQLLTGRPVVQLKIPACLATQTYAIGRTAALWGKVSQSEVLDRYDAAQRLVRTNEPNALRLRAALEPVWSALTAVSLDTSPSTGMERQLATALWRLKEARLQDSDEAIALERAFADLPEAAFLRRLPDATPEARLKEFDALVSALAAAPPRSATAASIAFLAGYLATIAAGGSSSLGLAEDIANVWPEVTAWAYTLGGVGERVTWTSSFDGLGRLVVRELERPFRIDEPPTCDFALDEAVVVVDKQLSDPLVHLRVKQLRVATVALYPGVNVSVPFADQPAETKRHSPAREADSRVISADNDILDLLVKALVPRLRQELMNEPAPTVTAKLFGSRGPKPRSKRPPTQSKLPLVDK
jgi:hypothetical protein